MFNKNQQQKMNNNQPVDTNKSPFSQSLINSKIIAFNIIPNVNADGKNPPYNNHLGNHINEYDRETTVPLLNKTGAKNLNNDVKKAENNMKTYNSNTESNDEDINNVIRYDANDRANLATEPGRFFGSTRKDGSTIMDGEDSNAIGDEGYGHPELYQVEKDDINADYMGNMNKWRLLKYE